MFLCTDELLADPTSDEDVAVICNDAQESDEPESDGSKSDEPEVATESDDSDASHEVEHHIITSGKVIIKLIREKHINKCTFPASFLSFC